jgi:hypothetical protein
VYFPLTLRIPGWCETPRLSINGKDQALDAGPGRWVVISRTWQTGDLVALSLPMRVTVREWAKNRNSLSVDYGPITFSLKIEERWSEYDNGRPWKAFEVFPESDWNFGLPADVQKDPTAAFQVVQRGVRPLKQPFTPNDAPLLIRTKGGRIAEWKQEENGLVGQLPQSPVKVAADALREVTLIPMGCARLRISSFPTVEVALE